MFSLPIDAADLAVIVLLASVAFLVFRPLLHYLLDPLDLRKYPTPGFLAATTQWWILRETWLERRSRSIHDQHERLGDVIRIAPSLVIFNIPEAVPDIYGHAAARKLVKDTFYDKIAGEERDIVNVIDHGDHSQRRKYLSNSFALKTVTDMEPVIKQNFQRMLDYLDEIATQDTASQTLDIRRWFNYFTLDVIGDMAFGLPMGFLAGRYRPQQDFMNKILTNREGETRGLSFERLLSESIVFMNAGSETTAAGLSSTLYFLLSNPECFEKLRAEIDARLGPNHDGIVSYDSAKDLPYLRACIDESLRLRPPIAYALQRLVVSPQGAIIAGHHIKQGTTVAVSPWTIHRNRKLHKNPDEFDPERWFDPEQLSNLRRYYIVFSQGPRQCLGRHIAIVELQILIPTLVRRYDMYLADPEMDFVIFDRFNSNPGPLPVKVERRVFVD
ncbi:benzoate 4-monooxygenase cytochrome P450 [Fusarium tjaetaba]|uniref:Benzoate 4-monooxygenase cytochrome P450 n=1 Tax=Fusarium tjaetaba TaxID=1567544 RepID=A0A8H5RAC5_9HYPO|nr:benzoate 4-monooxygenase cytochrome P450 [Fusarium tjaetaba]KAF5630971.1 benzoate 4-monooxygenase cytochrome P450 [Fusarium tjaetaba]